MKLRTIKGADMNKLQKLQRRLEKIEMLKKGEPNNSYNDWDKKIERLEEKIELEEAYEQGRADAINECISKIDKLTTYYAGDKEGKAITPKVVIKEEVIKVLEQLKEQSNE